MEPTYGFGHVITIVDERSLLIVMVVHNAARMLHVLPCIAHNH